MRSSNTQLLERLELGDSLAVDELFPRVYTQLRRLAASRMAFERSDHTLQATGLVHETFMRLMDRNCDATFGSMAQFYAAAAETMRRILIDHARKKNSLKRGGRFSQIGLEDCEQTAADSVTLDQLLDLDELLEQLRKEEPEIAELVSLRVYAGLSVTEASQVIGISRSAGYQLWDYALAWFAAELQA
ncbi:MAG TPA: RNA polymerase subunit sigma [Planctomycetaceae bacterium]|nr:RNA polymerase subunit sigma [Planctomycetaceae bacterium]